MFRFFLIFAFLTSVVTGQQTIVLTFSGGESGLATQEDGISYNVLSNDSSGYCGTTKIPVTGLLYTDGSKSGIGVSFAPIAVGGASVSGFEGDTSLFSLYFGDVIQGGVDGVISSDVGETKLALVGVSKGDYTLTVLGARGDEALGNGASTNYYLVLPSDAEGSIEVDLLSWNGSSKPVTSADNGNPLINALTVGTDHIATNWALMQFHVSLKEDVSWVKLCAAGNYGNVAAVAFTSVPEPSTMTMALLVVCGMAACRRRRK